jgi:hypothetical protein
VNDHLYTTLAQLVGARARCLNDGNHEWKLRHEERIKELVRNHLPAGSGFDSGTHIVLEACSEEKLVFHTSFHHMDEHGSYDGWTEHDVRVYPSLAFGFRLTISGPNKNDIKEYIDSAFNEALQHTIDKAA